MQKGELPPESAFFIQSSSNFKFSLDETRFLNGVHRVAWAHSKKTVRQAFPLKTFHFRQTV